jgi:hypothetical protein
MLNQFIYDHLRLQNIIFRTLPKLLPLNNKDIATRKSFIERNVFNNHLSMKL